ncbi:hypothetical protein AKO1_007286 [Acrasis kona]|uniref:Dipeptidase n=1 Tax=Acrasis kona TaxID=1008807 RepID=A0AAW2YSI2_9EUKA
MSNIFIIPVFLAVVTTSAIYTLIVVIKSLLDVIRFARGQNNSVFLSSFKSVLASSLFYAFFFHLTPKLADFATNGFPPKHPIVGKVQDISSITFDEAQEVHNKFLFVSDLHADTFLWPHRGFITQSTLPFGYVDVPRLIQGNIGLQVFATVTQSPMFQNMESNSNATDVVGLIHMAQGYHRTSYTSALHRALVQTQRLQQTAELSGGSLIMIKSKKDLTRLLSEKASGKKVVGGLMCIEGAQAFENNVDNVVKLFDAGVRMVGVSHFVDTEFGGSAHGDGKYGLTEFGHKALSKVIELNMIVDLAHSSRSLFFDIIDVVNKKKQHGKTPLVIVSHTGVKGTVNTSRNLDDEQLKAVADLGGVIGVTFFKEAIGGSSVSTIVDTIRYVVKVIGVDHVSLGSDFDGSVRCPLDCSQYSHITYQLLRAGFGEKDVEKIMGGNVRRVLEQM